MRPLYCDESIWVPLADGLRRRGWTVHTVRDEDLLGAPDREQLSHARSSDWILVTFDDDSSRSSKGPASNTPVSSTRLDETSVTS